MKTKTFESCVWGVRFVAALLMLLSADGNGQGSAGTSSKLEPRRMVDMPTAGILLNGDFAFDTQVFREGGVLVSFAVGFLNRASIGLSYGGLRVIGEGSPAMNAVPGFELKLRAIEESVVLPAIALGFDTQGSDGYIKEADRYAIKSPGVFAVASKNYSLLGYLSFHGGVNYTLERADGDRDINFFVGGEKTIGSVVSATMEYNAGLNDNNAAARGKGRGYVNASVGCSFGGGLTVAVCLKDLLRNGSEGSLAKRTIRFEFVRSF